jgi:hypothetical protein
MAEEEELLSAKDLISRHEQWKLTLWAAIFTRKPLTVQQIDQIVHAAHCPIGRWLEAQASTDVACREEYQEVVENHDDFHQEMMQVAVLLSSKDFQGAAKAIQDGSGFARSGKRLAQSILTLNRIQRIMAPA